MSTSRASHIIELNKKPSQDADIELASGRRIAITEHPDQDELTVRAPSGLLEVKIKFTPDGPVLEMAASQIQLRSQGAVSVQCEQFNVHARSGIRLETHGNLAQQVQGDHVVNVHGKSETSASSMRLESRDGDLEVDSKRDVWIDSGDRVMINC